jgi:hypothetical protein
MMYRERDIVREKRGKETEAAKGERKRQSK